MCKFAYIIIVLLNFALQSSNFKILITYLGKFNNKKKKKKKKRKQKKTAKHECHVIKTKGS